MRRPAPPRSHPARSGTHGSSPAHPPGRANTNCPSAVHRARSPVRYIRSPDAERTRHEPLAGQTRPGPHSPGPARHRPHTTHRPPRPAPAPDRSSSTNTRVFAIGATDHGTTPAGHRPRTSSRTTVVSVGPYALISRRPADHRPHQRPGPTPHRADHQRRHRPVRRLQHRQHRRRQRHMRHLSRCSTRPAARLPGSSSSAGATTNARTANTNATSTSDTDASKPNDANCNTPTPGTDARTAATCADRQVHQRPRCVTATPFGVPVDPDV